MLGNSPYYYESLRRYIIAFAATFNNIYIQKYNKDNSETENTAPNANTVTSTVVEQIKVPISYGPSNKYLSRLGQDPELNRPVAITLPRMSFEMTGMNYASNRKISSIGKRSTADGKTYVFNPIPIDIMFQLNIMVKETDDGSQILEQILPFFQPAWINRIKIIDELNIEVNAPIIFTMASSTDMYNGDFTERRALVWTLDFIMQTYFYGPLHTGGLIKIAKADIYADLDADDWSFESIVTPGMTANGTPTSNAALSVNPLTINANDNWDYVVGEIDKTANPTGSPLEINIANTSANNN